MPATRTPSALSIKGWSSIVGASQSKIVDLMVENVANVAALAGAVLLLASSALITQILGAFFALAACLLVGWLLRRDAARRESLLAAYGPVRIVLALATAGGLLLRRPDQVGWSWTATGLIIVAVVSEPTVKTLLSKTEPVAERLPGVQNVPRPPFSPDLLPVISLALILVGGLLAALRSPVWIFFVIALIGLAATVAMVVHSARANLVSKRSAAGVRAALLNYEPAFAVYYGGINGARYQLGMWLPYLERLDRPFVVITRNAETVPVIAELTSAPILVPRLHSVVGNLDQMVVPSLKAAFYVQGSPANLTFQRYRKLTHVWLNHGDSDKAANFGARHATYDRVFVSGQQGVERYAAHGVTVPPERFALVGRPQIERIEVRDQPPVSGSQQTVLYAPTWRGGRPATDYSSLPLGEKIVAGLLTRGCTVIFRPHPLSYAEPEDAGRIRAIQQQLQADRSTSGGTHVWGARAETDWDIPACINASDALVTDVSSVATDYLASGKPLAMVAIRTQGAKFLAETPMARVSYVIEKDLSTLDATLDQLLGDDTLAADRRAYRRHCIGDGLGSHAAEEFLRIAGGIVDGVRSTR